MKYNIKSEEMKVMDNLFKKQKRPVKRLLTMQEFMNNCEKAGISRKKAKDWIEFSMREGKIYMVPESIVWM